MIKKYADMSHKLITQIFNVHPLLRISNSGCTFIVLQRGKFIKYALMNPTTAYNPETSVVVFAIAKKALIYYVYKVQYSIDIEYCKK